MSENLPEKKASPNIVEDAKRLAKRSAAIGAALALFCHLLPPHYRAVCDMFASICKGEF